jgi:hypothetical protein
VCVTPSASRAAPFKPHSICRSDGKWARGAQHRAPRFSVSGLSNNHSDGPARGLSACCWLCCGTFFGRGKARGNQTIIRLDLYT